MARWFACACFFLVALGSSSVAAQPFAYLPDRESPAISVVDLSSRSVVETIALSGTPGGDVELSPDASRLYVVIENQPQIDIVDTDARSVIGQVALPEPAFDLQVNGDGSQLYAGLVTIGSEAIAEIDTATAMVTRTLPLTPFDQPGRMALGPGGANLYVAGLDFGSFDGFLLEIDTATLTIARSLDIPRQDTSPSAASDVVIDAVASTAYVGISTGPFVVSIDLASFTFVEGIQLPDVFSLSCLALLDNDSRLLASGGSLVLYDLASAAVVDTQVLSPLGSGFDLTSDGGTLVVPRNLGNDILLLEPGSLASTGSIPGVPSPTGCKGFVGPGALVRSLEIPTLDTIGAGILAVLLTLGSLVALRRRREAHSG